MAKSLLLNILVEYLGKYVEGLNSENLQVGVWSGKVELHNLKLKSTALDNLHLPIKVTRGSLKKLKLKVPWTQLDSKPVRVILDGIYLQASPVDVTKLSPEECNELVQLSKRNKLREIEESIIASIESKKGGFADKAMKAGYIQQMTTKIVDNIEITLANLHIRYEDHFSIPGSVFSAGITLESLTLAAADENWVSAFITRARETKSGTADTSTAAAVRKLGTLDNLCVYWNAESNTLEELTYDVWESTMFSLIYATKDNETTTSGSLSDTLYYILSPPNNLTVKIIENSKPSDAIPKIEMTVESSTVPLQFDKLHYEQILGITGVFVQMQSNLQMGLYRPAQRPTVDPQAWWKYAYKLVTGKDPAVAKRTETMMKCMRQRSKYMSLVKTRRLNIDAGKQVPLSVTQADGLKKIEEDLPLIALLEFHQLAIKDARYETAASPQKSRVSTKVTKGNAINSAHSPVAKGSSSSSSTSAAAGSKPASKSIFSYFSFGKSESKDVEDEELLRKLEEKFSLTKSIDDETQLFSFRINIITSLALNLQYDYLPVVSLKMSLRSRLEMKVNNFSMSFELNNFSVKDTCTPQPFNEYIISMWDHSTITRRRSVGRLKHVATSYDPSAVPQLIISFESKPGKEALMISALPLQISWNEKCLVKLIGLWIDRSDIIPEKSITSDVVSLSNMDRRLIASIKDKFASEAAVSYEGSLELFVEVEAPIITIPENSQSDSGYLLLDSGYLTIHAVFDHSGMDWDIQLKDINIGMPTCYADYTTTLENEIYLVKPFTISFGFDSRQQDVCDLGISASASPSLTANFDAKKIVRLIAVVNVIINSFDFNSVNSLRLVKKRRESISCSGTPVQKMGDKQLSKKFTYAANAPKPFALDTQSLNRITVQATVKIPLVSVTLTIADNHVIEMSLLDIDCIILQRLQDINARVSSKGLSLKDSLRPVNDQEVVWTPTENETESNSLISFSYRVMYSTMSPLYDGYEQEISLLLPKLCISIDDETIIKLSPFVRNVLMFYNDYNEKQPNPSEPAETISLTRASSPPPTSLGGLHLTVSVDGICIYLLSPLVASTSDTLCESYNESAFCLSVDKIYADLHFGELVKIDTYLTSFSINDTRKSSQKYFYHTLICKSSDYINLNFFDVAEAAAGMDVDTAHSISEAINAGVQKLLYVSYNQNSPSETAVDICIRDITSVIAVDLLLDLVNLIMKIVKAVNDLMAEISSDKSQKDPPSTQKGEKLRKLMRRSFTMHPHDLNYSAISDGDYSAEPVTPSTDVPPATVYVNVKLINPLLLLLENPEIASSKAIVSRCKFSFHYKYNMTDLSRNESKEVMHGSLRSAEIFVLTDMMKIGATPHQIIEPTSIDFHYKHTTENNEDNTGITVTSDAIHCRVSLNDLVLATSIINRASLVRSVSDSGHETIEADERALDFNFKHESSKGDSAHPVPSMKNQASVKSTVMTVFDFKLNLGKIHLVLVNDVSGQNVPILRAILDGTEFIASGTSEAISGDGSLFLAADYFNTSIGSWEPLVEQWHPLIKISKEMKYIKVEVWNDYTLQINLSGVFFKCLYNTLSLISRIGKEGSYVNRNQLNPLTIVNHLGIPVELFDGNTKKSIMVLDSNILSSIPSLNASNTGSSSGKKLASKNSKLFPSEFEIHLLGPMKDMMFPVIHLPLTCSKPRLYSFHPLNELVSRAVTYGEPIVEDAYENSRYYPLQARWGAPWTHMGDPQEWSDGRGKGSRELTSITLPMNWEWVEPSWKVDMAGEIGRNIDSDGWEYSMNFNSFSLTNARRTKQPMDSVRRRRWIRRRVPKSSSPDSNSSGTLRPLNVIWDVKMQPDGSREIQLRSQHQFKNEMSFAMEIEASTSNSPTSTVMKFLVPEKSQFNIPLTQKEWKYIRMRPANFPYNSSAYVNCKIFESNIQIQCEGTDLHDLYMIVNVIQEQKSVLISCCPQAILVNYLPVDISYRLLNTQLESGILRAGSRVDIAHVDFRRPVSTTIDIGTFTCKNPIVLSSSKNVSDEVVELVSSSDDQILPITLNATLTPIGYMELIVYCRYAVVDRSESRIIIQSKRNRGTNLSIHREVIERRTYRRLWAGSQQQRPQNSNSNSNSSSNNNNNNSIQDCWINGFHGISLFHAFDNKVSIGVNEGSAWQHDISLISLGPSKTPIAITDRQTSSLYHLAVSLKPMEGVFSGTRLLTVMPNFEIVNCMEEKLFLLQCGDDTFTYNATSAESVSVKSRGSVGLSKLNSHKSTAMRLRCESTAWSVGTVDINEIGTTLLILPRSSGAAETEYGSNLIIAHVEVKFSDPSDNSYMRIIIWQSSFYSMGANLVSTPKRKKKSKQPVALSIKNDTELPLIVYQVGIDHMLKSLGVNKMLFDLCVPPGSWLPYGWTDQSISSILAISVGTSSHDLLGSTAHVDVLQIGQMIELDTSQIQTLYDIGPVFLVIKTFRGGKVVHIFSRRSSDSVVDPKFLADGNANDNRAASASTELLLQFYFNSIGLSIIAERPTRRELFSLYVEKVEVSYQQMQDYESSSPSTLFQFLVKDIQIDNYSESALYPVLLNSFNSAEKRSHAKHKNNLDDPPFFSFSIVIITPTGQKTPVVKLCVVRVLEIKLSIDSGTILIYFNDLHDDLFIDSYHDMIQDHRSSELFIKRFNDELLSSIMDEPAVDIDAIYESAQTTKIYFESVILHPVKINLTFAPVNFSRPFAFESSIMSKYPWISIIQNMAAVDEFEIKIKSFIVKNAMESLDSLGSRVMSKVVRDLQLHLVLIAGSLFGSLSFLGKPAGLMKNIGDGVQDFFYEPYLGLQQSPTDFVIGVGKGTGSLLAGVASGVLVSTATLVGTASSGVGGSAAMLTGDKEYLTKRQEKFRELKASHGGVVSGLKAGGESVLDGFVSGISGLVTKPVEEIQKSGALGIFKGVGLGIVGVAMKPVIGVTDGISSIASGVTQQLAKATGDSMVVTNARAQRAFERSSSDDGDLVLVPIDTFAADAQYVVLKLAKTRNYNDSFVACVCLGFSPEAADNAHPFAVCLSEMYVFVLNRECASLLQVPFGDVSHFEQITDLRIDLIVYRGRSSSSLSTSTGYTSNSGSTNANCILDSIHCANKVHASRLYAMLLKYAQRMGNPSAIRNKSSSGSDASSTASISPLASPRVNRNISNSDNVGYDDETGGSSSSDKVATASFLPPISPTLKPTPESYYQFGTANSIQFANVSLSNSEIIQRARDSLFQQRPLQDINDIPSRNAFQRDLDWKVWLLISNWRNNHFIFHPSRCLACLIVNCSPNQVQITEVQLKEGENNVLLGVNQSFDPDSRTLLPHGGSAVVFLYGYTPSLTDLAHVKAKIVTTAFTAEVSTRKNRMNCENNSGHTAGYLEKSQSDWWAKCVICVFT